MVETAKARNRRFVGWLIFSLLASLVPILWIFLKLVIAHQPHGWEVVAGGDLIIIGFVLAVGAVGDLLVRKTTQPSGGDLARIGLTILFALCGAWLYGAVTSMGSWNDKTEPGVISLLTFGVTIIFGITNVLAREA